jgi:hypothetical protein
MKLRHSKRVKAHQMLKKSCGAPTMPTPVVLYTGFTHARWASKGPNLQQIPKAPSPVTRVILKAAMEFYFPDAATWDIQGTTTGRHTSAKPNMEEVEPPAKGS